MYKLEFINKVSIEEFQSWTDKYGMIQNNNQGETTGNGNLFTAHYVFGLHSNGLLTVEEITRINRVYLNNFKVLGLLMRDPDNQNNWQAHDDAIGMMAADALMNKHRFLTQLYYNYGKNVKIDGIDESEPDPKCKSKNKKLYTLLSILTLNNIKWVWNNQNPNKFHSSSWLWRRLEMMATMQMSLRMKVNPLYWIYWAITMLLLPMGKVNKEYRDGYTLRFHSAIACQGYGPITDWICKKVRMAIHRDYGDFGNLLANYFNNPNHPLVALCRGKY